MKKYAGVEMLGLKEEWKDINGYEGLYQVSNYGRVKNLKTGKILKQSPNTVGYLKVGLSKEGKQKTLLVHRLVADAFIPNPDKKPHVDHADGNKENNCISNLGWVTLQDNLLFKATPIKGIHLKTGKEEIFLGVGQAARELGLHKQNISSVLRGRLKYTGGYTFKRMVGYQ
jgi:hypothetical protein